MITKEDHLHALKSNYKQSVGDFLFGCSWFYFDTFFFPSAWYPKSTFLVK